jgi:N-methylhydantoinase A
MPLDVTKAYRAVAELGDALGLSPVETARGILTVVNANMVRALRLVTVQRGVNPTELALLPFGGAGPLHAGALARELGIPTILVPPAPGILCALGLLVEDLRADAVRTWVGRLDARSLSALAKVFRELEAAASQWLDRERVPAERRQLSRWVDLRYEGQNYELLVPVPDEVWRAHSVEPLRRSFLQAHEETYGFAAEDEPIQIVNLRLVARGLPEPPELPRQTRGGPDASAAMVGRRSVDFAEAGGALHCPVYARSRLAAGHYLVGPAVIEQFDSTTLLHPGQQARVDELGFLVITEV